LSKETALATIKIQNRLARVWSLLHYITVATLASNRKAAFDFEILKTFEAGVELRGFEVKSLRRGLASLEGAYAIVRGGEVYLVGMTIPPYQPGNTPAAYRPDRTRRLLLKKDEIAELAGWESKKGLTIIASSV